MKNSSFQSAASVQSLGSPIASPHWPLDRGWISQARLVELPLGAGHIFHLVREYPHRPPQAESWALSGGLWALGATRIADALPRVADLHAVDPGMVIAERLRTPLDSAEACAQEVLAAVRNFNAPAADLVAQAMELLGLSNRQVAIYARRNFEMVSGLAGDLEETGLLKHALLARAAMDRMFEAIERLGPRLGRRLSVQGAREAVVQGGLNAGLSVDDAEKNARWMIEQLEVFSGSQADQGSESSVSHDDVMQGARTLASQQSFASPVDSSALLKQLDNRVRRMSIGTEGGGSAGPDPLFAGGLRKRRRGDSSVHAQDGLQGGMESLHSLDGFAAGERTHAGVSAAQRPAGLRALAQGGPGEPDRWLGLTQKLSSCEPKSGMARRIEARRCTSLLSQGGLSPQGVSQDSLCDEMDRVLGRHPLSRLVALRDAALIELRRHLKSVNALNDGQALAPLARAQLFPLEPTLCADGSALRAGVLLQSGNLEFVIGYPVALLAELDEASVSRGVRAMLHLLIDGQIRSMINAAEDAHGVPALRQLARELLAVVNEARYPPRSGDVPRVLDLEGMHHVVIDGLATALTGRVMGESRNTVLPYQMGWDDIIDRALARISYRPAIERGLMGREGRARAMVFSAIAKEARSWLDEVAPAFDNREVASLVDTLVVLANGVGARPQPFSHAEVRARLRDHFWDFMRDPMAGFFTAEGLFEPARKGPVAWIQHSVLERRLDVWRIDAARRVLDASVLALVSRDTDGLYNLLLYVVERADHDPKDFVERFLMA